MSTKRVKIEADVIGRGKMSIDGVDVSEIVQGVSVGVFRGMPTEIIVQFVPGDVQIDVEGAIGLMSKEAQFLEHLDPREVDQEAMNRMEFGEDRTLTELVIEVLKEKVNGA